MSADTPPPIGEPTPQQQPQATPPPASSGGIADHTWYLLSHLSGLVGYLGNGIGAVIAPLIIYLIKKDNSPVIASHAKEALNFNISIAIYAFALFILAFATLGVGLIIVIPAGMVLAIGHLALTIVAAIKANEGILYRYPFTLRLVK